VRKKKTLGGENKETDGEGLEKEYVAGNSNREETKRDIEKKGVSQEGRRKIGNSVIQGLITTGNYSQVLGIEKG